MLETVECVSEEVMQYYSVLHKFFGSDGVHFFFSSGFTDLLLHSNCINFHKLQDILQINTRSGLKSQGEEWQMPFLTHCFFLNVKNVLEIR